MERPPEADSITAEGKGEFAGRSPVAFLVFAVALSVPFWILGAVGAPREGTRAAHE